MAASSSQARRGEEVIRFIKIIFESTILDKKLKIPSKFISEFGQQLVGCAAATLEAPSGDKWEVGLEKDRQGFVWFCNDGWERFAKFYTLEHGHFLLFGYRGRTDFSVVICDIYAAEIPYPTLSFPARVEIEHEEEDSLPISLESLSVDAAAANEKAKSPMVDDSAGSYDASEDPSGSELSSFKIRIPPSYLNARQRVNIHRSLQGNTRL